MRATLATLVMIFAAAAPASAAGPLAQARLTACDAVARTAAFEGDVLTRRGAVRMQIRFTLQMRDGKRWTRMERLGPWNTSDAGVNRYVFTKTVANLPAPGAYRSLVLFRWLDGAGKVIARGSQTTRSCAVADPRPNLAPVRVETRDGGWAVVVRNRGRTDSGPFGVILAADGAERPARELVGLAAGANVTLIFQPSDCRAGLRVVVDAGGAVDERDEGDNVLDVPCPA